MAVIGEIQKRPWLLLVVIFVGMLAFILGDAINSRGGTIEQSEIATVNGKGLTSAEYQIMVDKEFVKLDSAYRLLYRQPAPSALKQQLNDQYINQYLTEQMLNAEFAKLGINVPREQFNDLIQGKNVDGSIYEQYGLFVGPDRKFSQDSLNKNIQNYIQNGGLSFVFNDIIGEQAVKLKKQNKYINMIKQGLYVTSYEAKKSFESNSTAGTFDYVYRSFASVPETGITITDEDLKAYYAEHKSEKQFEQKDKFNFQYASFPITPSEEDLEIARDFLTKRVQLFKDAENDTTFIVTNSDTRNLDFSAVAEFPKEIDSIVKNAQNGDVIGPYLHNGFYKISKVISNEYGEEAEVRHILLGNDKYPNQALQVQRADSLVKVIKRNRGSFGALVKKFSSDQGSIEKGGKYEWFDKKQMVPEFTAVSFNEPVGTVKHTRTKFGIHIIEVLKRRKTDKKELKVATVDSEVRLSKETISQVRDKALDFVAGLNQTNVSDSVFASFANEKNISFAPSQEVVLTQKATPQIEKGLEIIKRWAFDNNTKEGDVSDDLVFDEKVIIAHLISKSKEGTPTFDKLGKQTLDYLRAEVLKEKQAEVLKSKMSGSTLEEIAKNAETTIQNAKGITLANPILGSSPAPEYKVVGTALGMKENTVSKPVIGETGVFVVSLKSIQKQETPTDLTQNKQGDLTQLRRGVINRVIGALREKSNLKDNREKVNILNN